MAMICSKLGTRLLLSVLAAPILLNAQRPLAGLDSAGAPRMFPTDRAILEVQDPRQDLPCSVNPVKPALGFDLRFHAGYEVGIPLKHLAGPENQLTMIFRVTPEAHKDEPAYFVQRVRVPPIEPEASGTAYLEGSFDLGEGRYHVDWLMRDRSEHLCSSYWDAEATLPPKDKQLVLPIQPGAVQAAEEEAFKEEPPVQRTQDEPPLNVKVLVNFAPQNAHGATLQPLDTSALVSILRTIVREPRIGRFSVVAFNLEEQRILYRQQDSEWIDFPALGEALHSLNLGTVDLGRLSQKNGETEFLANLIQRETGGADHPDALIFAGPKALIDESVPTEVQYPVFYMNYNLHPQTTPWRDAIGRAVKFFKGYEYTISRPRDLWAAVSEIVSKTVKLKNVRRMAVASGSE
jgi:hypothetical protein